MLYIKIIVLFATIFDTQTVFEIDHPLLSYGLSRFCLWTKKIDFCYNCPFLIKIYIKTHLLFLTNLILQIFIQSEYQVISYGWSNDLLDGQGPFRRFFLEISQKNLILILFITFL